MPINSHGNRIAVVKASFISLFTRELCSHAIRVEANIQLDQKYNQKYNAIESEWMSSLWSHSKLLLNDMGLSWRCDCFALSWSAFSIVIASGKDKDPLKWCVRRIEIDECWYCYWLLRSFMCKFAQFSLELILWFANESFIGMKYANGIPFFFCHRNWMAQVHTWGSF